MKLRSLGAAVLLCLGLAATAQAAGPPTQLTVGDLQRPLNVEGAPQFGWMPAADQTAYQVTVAKGATQVWDSGKVPSSDQSYVPYAGPALATGEAYDWTVKTWDKTDTASPAATGHFETGLTDQGWSGANWIRRITTGNDSTDDWTYARKQFPALSASPVTRARIYASSLGQYDVHVNGKLLAPRRQLQLSDRGASTTRSTPPTPSGRPAADARRALSLLDLHLPGPRQRPGLEHDAERRAGRRRDQPQGRRGQRLRPGRPDLGRRRDDHGHRDRHGRRDRHRASRSRPRCRPRTPRAPRCSTSPARAR